MGLRGPLGNPHFASIWTATLVSAVGSSIHSMAVIWLAYEISGGPLLVSAVAVASLVPDLLFSMPAGALVDRWNRKRVMIAADVVRFVSVGTIPIVAVVAPDSWLLPAVVVAAVVEGMMAAFVTPARSAVIPRIVDRERLDAANSLLLLTTNAARICYVVGGGLIALIGTIGAFGINAMSFLLAALLLVRVPTSAGRPEESDGEDVENRTTIGDVVHGVRYIGRTPIVLSVVFLSMVAGLASGPLAVVLPFFVETSLNGESTGFGLLYGSVFGGTIAGSLAIGASTDGVSDVRGPFMIGGLATSGVALAAVPVVVTGISAPLAGAAVCMALFGAGIAAIQVPGQTLMHTIVPDDHRGRVFSAVKTLALASPPLAIVAAGPLVDRLGPGAVLTIEGGLIVVAAVALLFSPLFGVRGGDDPVNQASDRPTGPDEERSLPED